MTDFRTFLMQHAPAVGPDMHLTHCTSGGACFEILAELALAPGRCSVYEQDLLYLFYGRPAFKPNSHLGSSTLAEVAPVCLVIDPSVLRHAIRVLPFDSGGFNRYHAFLGPSLKLEQFEMGMDPTAPLRLISAFYETTQNYYLQQHRQGLNIPPSNRAAAAYSRLISDPSISDDDDRRGTIEVQLSTAISLKDALRAIIAPSVILDDTTVIETLKACPEALVLDYRIFGRTAPIGLTYGIYQRLEHFLASKGCFL